MSSTSKSRLVEIEEKRRRLNELREANKRRKESSSEQQSISSSNGSNTKVDDLLHELGIKSIAKNLENANKENEKNKKQIGKEKLTKLEISKLDNVSIDAPNNEKYSKRIQTDEVELENVVPMNSNENHEKKEVKEVEEKMEEEIVKSEVQVLDEDERKQLEDDDTYVHFLSESAKVCDRILCQNEDMDVLFNYYPENLDEKKSNLDANEMLKEKHQFFFKEGGERFVTSLQLSPHHPELVMTSHFKPNLNSTILPKGNFDDEGMVLIWNNKFHTTTPEYVLSCESWIGTSCFSPYHPSYVIGGSQTGIIVIWDIRASTQPIMRTSSLGGHSKMVMFIDVVGNANTNNIVSVGKDGKLCTWNLKKLNNPMEVLELNDKKINRPVSVNCFKFLPYDSNNFLVGTEERFIYSGCCSGQKAGLNKCYGETLNPINSFDIQPPNERTDTDQYNYLTSSTSNVIHLRNTKDPKFVHRFVMEHRHIINDVKWSPVHPAVFASCDHEGMLKIWNLNENGYISLASESLDGMSISNISFTSDGKHLFAASYDGRITVFDLNEIFYETKSEDWKLFKNLMTEMNNAQN
ncbi:hypothetical protein SNEBB_004324 [Seison nebaliae]|nr:hypothetical protein SNEBB_004324 [Seison nebaliae]